MKKTILFVLSFLFMTSLMFAQLADDLFISEYMEGSSSNKAFEIFNGTGAPVDLSGYLINRSNNGAIWANGTLFTYPVGTIIADGDVWVNVNSSEALGMSTVADSIGGFLTWFNGDDSIGLFKITATDTVLIDVIGENGVDPGDYWPVAGVSNGTQEHTLVRKSSVTVGNTDWTASSGTNATNSEWIVYDQNTWDNLGSHTFGGNALPLITNVFRTPAGDVLASTTIEVSATVTDADGTVDLVELHWGLTSGSLTNTINMSVGFLSSLYITDTDIPAQTVGTTVYYQVYAEDDFPESSTSAEYDYTVIEAQSTTIPYAEPFDADLGQCYTYNDSGATKNWYWTDFDMNGYAYMSGYNSGDTEVDWLVLPAIDFDSYANETMTFETLYNYGTDDLMNYLKLYYSPDYSGLGDPNSSTWTELTFDHPTTSLIFTTSGSIDLSAITGSSVYIAFKYRYEVSMYRNWEVDNISIIEGNPPLVADFEADQTFVAPGTTVNFTDLTTGGATPYSSWAWDLDADGQYDDEFVANPAVEFPTIGTYTIALKVIDADMSEDIEIKVDYIVVAEISEDVIINEVDCDQVGTDAAEFIELYDGGVGNSPLDGYVVVLYNGSTTDASYDAIDLDTYSTDANGYFVIGSATVPNVDLVEFTTNGLQNGADAVALYLDDASSFPNGTAVTTTNLVDAIVYDTSDSDDPELLVLLNALEPQVDEDGNGNKDTESNQRIPNGSGGARNTSTYAQAIPTPGAMNQAGTLDPPTDLVVTVNSADIDLIWTAVAGATGYNVFRSTDPYNFGAVYDTSVTNFYTDIGAASGAKYFYKVTATN
ncbi:MAG: lamin tail domain-containing protein [Candidatus Tenebribacter burtonii]|nr:lamin tail domain-containing protein [Candidatus Tenebribacter burtonii]